jgi:hypothetical protein
MIALARIRYISMRQILELKAHPHQFVLRGLGHSILRLTQYPFQYPLVLAQGIIDIADPVARYPFQFIIESVPAIIITEFFIDPSSQRFSALETILSYHLLQSFLYHIKLF